jgi:hypothetical protein
MSPVRRDVRETLLALTRNPPGAECDRLLIAALPALERLPAIPDGLAESFDKVSNVVAQLCPGHAFLAWREGADGHACAVSPGPSQLEDFRWCARATTPSLAYLVAAMAMLHGLPPGWVSPED